MTLGGDVETSLPSESTPLLSNGQQLADPSSSTSSAPVARKDKGPSRRIDVTATSGNSTPVLALPDTSDAASLSDARPQSKSYTVRRRWRETILSPFSTDFVALNLENSGSVARDHLASERTFLAYVRTSLAVASSGVALIQLFTVASHQDNAQHFLAWQPTVIDPYVRPLGGVAIVFGIILLLIGVSRYFIVQSALTKGKFPAARLAIGFITLSLTAFITVVFGILLAGKLDADEPGPNPFL